MNAGRKSLCVWYIVYTVSTEILASAIAPVMTEACSRRPWNQTVCCIGGISERVLPGAEDTLSVAECDLNYNSSSLLGVNSISLVWGHPTLTLDTCPGSLDRIFLFSHCINPTNTSLDAPMNTLLYSSDRTHLTSSTTITQSGRSACSYFGCYGCLGFQYYTFSEVSCTPQNSMLASMQSTVVFSTLWTQLNIIVSPTETVVVESSSSVWQSSVQQFNITQSPEASPIHKSGLLIGFWLALLITSAILLSFTAAVVGVLLIARHWSRSRNTLRITKYTVWDTSNKISDSPPVLQTISLHSVHTLYEEVDSTHTQIDQSNDMKEESVVGPFGQAKYDSNCKCDSGFETSTCCITGTCHCNDNNSSSTCSNHSGNSTDNEPASYIPYGSLKNILQEQSMS